MLRSLFDPSHCSFGLEQNSRNSSRSQTGDICISNRFFHQSTIGISLRYMKLARGAMVLATRIYQNED